MTKVAKTSRFYSITGFYWTDLAKFFNLLRILQKIMIIDLKPESINNPFI